MTVSQHVSQTAEAITQPADWQTGKLILNRSMVAPPPFERGAWFEIYGRRYPALEIRHEGNRVTVKVTDDVFRKVKAIKEGRL